MTNQPNLQTIPLAKIQTNDYNPNEMRGQLFQTLVKTMKENGYVLPILVRKLPNSEMFEIVDGEHRRRAYQEVYPDATEIAVVVTADPSLTKAKIQTLVMNNVRGEENMIKLAKVIQDLQQDGEMSLEEIEEVTGYRASRLDNILGMLNLPEDPADQFNFGDGGGQDPTEPENNFESQVIAFTILEQDDFDIINKGLKEAAKHLPDGITDDQIRTKSFVYLCSEFIGVPEVKSQEPEEVPPESPEESKEEQAETPPEGI